MSRMEIREIGGIRVVLNNHPCENISSLKESKKFGGVRGKIYLCIRLAAARHNIQASLMILLSTCTIFA